MQVPYDKANENLLRYLQIAKTENVIITRHGVPVGILIGLNESDDSWEEALLQNPYFQERIAQARRSAREGKRFSIESLRSELSIDPPITPEAAE